MKFAIALCASLILLFLFLIQGVFFIQSNSQTVDEAAHLVAGYSYLATGDFRLDSEHPPLTKALQALPLFISYRLSFSPEPQLWHTRDAFSIGHHFLYRSPIAADRILFLSRMPNLFLGGMLVALTGWWAHRLWGDRAALLAIALTSLEPNLVAHSSLVTTDLGVTLFIFLAVYLFWEYANHPSWLLLTATGVATGAALASKFSALLLLPIICLIVALPILTGVENYALPSSKKPVALAGKIIEAAALLLFIFVVGFLTIPLAYGVEGFMPWISGLRHLLSLTQGGRPSFFFGEYSYQGWWNYFIGSFLIKTPIGSLVLIVASLILFRAGTPLTFREAIFLLLPPLFVFGATTQSEISIGLRHILPVYPFFFVLAARTASLEFARRWLRLLYVGAPVLFTAVSVLRIAPHQLAYFNEFVGGPDQGYRYLSDSNIDWGQDLKGLKTYIDKQNLPMIYLSYFGTAPPSYYGIRYQYVPGAWPLEWPPPADTVPTTASRKILAISVYNLQDVSRPYDPLFRWLWMRQPVAKIGFSIFIYDLTDDREGLMKLEESYVKAGISLPP
jgi:4-amino-4-deoxy-L-arabinose transferase-like glycosyltransferase